MVQQFDSFAMSVLNILCKAPVTGLVKTRLAADLGEQAALGIYKQLLKTVFRRLQPWSGGAVQVHVTPWSEKELMEEYICPNWSLHPQSDGHLGQRMASITRTGFEQGNEKVLIIGADCPDINCNDLDDALKILDTHPMVFGPSSDGGYWLIGLRQVPSWQSVFENISWSTDQVLSQSLVRVIELGLGAPGLLKIKSDLDTRDDWDMLKDRLD